MNLLKIYDSLFKSFSHQGWWPLTSNAGKNSFDPQGYHHGNYDFPKTENEMLEICIGAILTQYLAFGLLLGVCRYFTYMV